MLLLGHSFVFVIQLSKNQKRERESNKKAHMPLQATQCFLLTLATSASLAI